MMAVLRGNERLVVLDMSGNAVTDSACFPGSSVGLSISEMLTLNRTLQTLQLGMNRLLAPGIQQLLNAVASNKNSAIKQVDVSAQLGGAPDLHCGQEDVFAKFAGLSQETTSSVAASSIGHTKSFL